MLTTKVENYPGFADGIMGQDLMATMRQQAEKLGVEIINQNAISLKEKNGIFSVSLNSSAFSVRPLSLSPYPLALITASAVILATGAAAITLKLPGEDRLMGRGVGTCAVCDAPFYKGKDTVFIIGGGDSAIEEASEISKFASKVIILVRKESLRATPILRKRIEAIQNIEIWYKSQALELLGDKRLEKVKINKDGNMAKFPADGLFYAIGHTPATKWLEGSGIKVDEKGYVLTPLSTLMSNKTVDDSRKLDDRRWKIEDSGGRLKVEGGKNRADRSILNHPSSTTTLHPLSSTVSAKHHSSSDDIFPTMTSVPGIFAAGDCVDFRYRQAIVAAGQGCMAALDAQKWLESFLP